MKKIFLLSLVSMGFLVGCDEVNKATSTVIDTQMDPIYQKVIDDSIQEYEITKKHGNAMEICVHAGMVKAAYLQAKDEANHEKWGAIEKSDCKSAGM